MPGYCQPQAKTGAAGNLFWKSPAWKRQVVTNVRMCPRADMYKPPQGDRLSMEVSMTQIQEGKQAAGLNIDKEKLYLI